MADKVVSLEFNVKTAGAVTEINKVTKATEGATTATNEYEKQLNDIKKQTDGGGFKELNRALKQYQDLALQAGENSPIGRQALSEAGELKDRLLDLKAAIKTTGQDGRSLQASLQLGGGIVAGFGAVQGVMALVGSESEDLQKTLVKLQAVQATLASVEEIRSVLEKESALRITAVTIAEKARAAATAVSTLVTNAGIMSLRAFKIALAATGIGAIVVVLIAAADAMGLFGDSADDTAKKVDKLNAATEREAESINKVNQEIDERTKRDILRAKIAGKTEGDIVKLEKDAQNEKIKNLIKYSKEADATFDKITRLKDSSSDQIEKARKQSEEAYANLQKAQTDRNLNSLEQELDLADKKREIEKEAERERKARAEENRKKAEAEAAANKKFREDRLEKEKDIAQKIADADFEISEAQKKKAAEAEEKAAEEKKAKDLQDIADKKKKQEDDLADEIRIRDAKVQIANDLQSTLTSLGNLIINDSAKAVKFNKAMALIQIGIDTATALSKALSVTQSPSPDNVATGGLAGVAKYAGIAAMIFANAAKAKQILSSGNAAGAPPTMGSGGSGAPRQMQIGAPSLPGSQSTMLREQVTTVKAIVVESDITSTQKRVNSIKENATI